MRQRTRDTWHGCITRFREHVVAASLRDANWMERPRYDAWSQTALYKLCFIVSVL